MTGYLFFTTSHDCLRSISFPFVSVAFTNPIAQLVSLYALWQLDCLSQKWWPHEYLSCDLEHQSAKGVRPSGSVSLLCYALCDSRPGLSHLIQTLPDSTRQTQGKKAWPHTGPLVCQHFVLTGPWSDWLCVENITGYTCIKTFGFSNYQDPLLLAEPDWHELHYLNIDNR